MIVIPSLNTSRDVIIASSDWRRGAVMRADQQVVIPGGKPLNVARFLGVMGVPCRLIALADASLAAEAAALIPSPVSAQFLVSSTRSRTDVAIVERGDRLTVFNGPAPLVPPAELDRALAAVEGVLAGGDLLVVAGSQPEGVGDRLVGLSERVSGRLLVDLSDADLVSALAARPELVKVNAAELARIRGVGAGRAWRNGGGLVPEAAALVVTWGRHGLRGWLPDGSVVRVAPPAARVVNPYGAGDAVTAAIAAQMQHGTVGQGALLDGAAWAAAVTETFSLHLDPDRALALREAVHAVSEGSWSR